MKRVALFRTMSFEVQNPLEQPRKISEIHGTAENPSAVVQVVVNNDVEPKEFVLAFANFANLNFTLILDFANFANFSFILRSGGGCVGGSGGWCIGRHFSYLDGTQFSPPS